MKALARRKKLYEPAPSEPLTAKAAKRQISLAAGTEAFYNRDPVYHVSETFQKTFDMNGRRLTAEIAAQREQPQRDEELEKEGGRSPITQTSMDEYYTRGENERYLDRFSQMAFSRGTLASAIIEGTGQMMLFTCMKRTVGQFQPRSARQRMLFPGSARKNVEGSPNKAVFNRGTTDSAVGMVADVTRDARRTVEALTDLSGGQNVLRDDSGADTLQRVYPFLSDDREQALIGQYRQRLSALEKKPDSEREKAITQRALDKTLALQQRKQYMKAQFIFNLRQMGDNARGMSAAFASEDFLDALNRAVNAGTDRQTDSRRPGLPDGAKIELAIPQEEPDKTTDDGDAEK